MTTKHPVFVFRIIFVHILFLDVIQDQRKRRTPASDEGGGRHGDRRSSGLIRFIGELSELKQLKDSMNASTPGPEEGRRTR